MSSNSIVFTPDTLRSIAASTFTGSYQAVGSALTVNPILVKFINNTSVVVTVSWDGVHAHDFFPISAGFIMDVGANKQIQNQCAVKAGTTFYVNAAAGTGSFYIAVFYLS